MKQLRVEPVICRRIRHCLQQFPDKKTEKRVKKLRAP